MISFPENPKVGNLGAMLKLARSLGTGASAEEKRRLIADFCRWIGRRLGTLGDRPSVDPKLPPRLRQTLDHLLAGDSEKQVAAKLNLSPHTVHIYVKSLYKHYQVSSRGELLAKCLLRAEAS